MNRMNEAPDNPMPLFLSFVLLILFCFWLSGCEIKVACKKTLVVKTVATIGVCSDFDHSCKVLYTDGTTGIIPMPVVGEKVNTIQCVVE